jgi:hypothetical protein
MFPALWRQLVKRALDNGRRTRQRDRVRPAVEALEDRLQPSITAAGQATSFLEGVAKSVVVATFSDTTAHPPASYTATIDWGDTTSSAGTVGKTGSTFTVTGSHAYTPDTPVGSPNTVTVTITDTVDADGGTATAARRREAPPSPTT